MAERSSLPPPSSVLPSFLPSLSLVPSFSPGEVFMGIDGRSYSRAGGALRCGALRSFSVRRVVVFFELVKKVRFAST